MATAAQHINSYRLELDQRGAEATGFELALRRKIVGQDEAVKAVADLYQTFRAGLNSFGRPQQPRVDLNIGFMPCMIVAQRTCPEWKRPLISRTPAPDE